MTLFNVYAPHRARDSRGTPWPVDHVFASSLAAAQRMIREGEGVGRHPRSVFIVAPGHNKAS